MSEIVASQATRHIPTLPPSRLEMIVKPPHQDLVRSQSQQVLDCLPVLAQPVQLWMELDIDLGKETPADDLPDETKDEMFASLGNIG